jgi:pimeloyl-ACP methyl ester carboxylesterase
MERRVNRMEDRAARNCEVLACLLLRPCRLRRKRSGADAAHQSSDWNRAAYAAEKSWRDAALLVGSSFGGYNVRVFNGLYPDEVVGIVLADATQEDQYHLLPKAWNAISAAMLKHCERLERYSFFVVHFGIGRLMLRAQGSSGDGAYLILQSKYLIARTNELKEIQVSAEQARAADHISDKRLIVLTAAENTDTTLSGGLSKQDFEAFQRIWVDDLQMRLARLSTRGRRVMVSRSGHDIPSDRPDAIVDAVRDIRAAATN